MHVEEADRQADVTVYTPGAAATDGINSALLSLGILLIARRRLIVVTTLGVAGLVFALALFFRGYTAASSFMPYSSGGNLSQLAGLAADFGANIAGAAGSQESVEFYGDLVTSEDLLKDVVLTRYRFATDDAKRDSATGDLIDLYGISRSSGNEALLKAVRRLRSHIKTDVDDESGLVNIQVSAEWPELAEQVCRRILDLVNQFDVQQRQTEAAAERRFTEKRYAQAGSELAATEDSLENLLEANRITESPRLQFESARLQRHIDVKQQVYLTLAQAFEQARIEEVRNTPVLTLVSAPERSAEPSLRTGTALILSLLIGVLFASFVVFTLEYIEQQRATNPGEVDRLGRMLRQSIPFRKRSSKRSVP